MGLMTVRDGVADDASAVEEVHWASLEAAYKDTLAGWPETGRDRNARLERWRKWLSGPDISIVGSVDGEIVGFCTIRPSEDEDADAALVAEMPTLYVHPDAWRRGYGQALCAEGLSSAAERGFDVLTLWVLEVNTRAHSFYSAFGFLSDGATKVVEDSSKGLVARRYQILL